MDMICDLLLGHFFNFVFRNSRYWPVVPIFIFCSKFLNAKFYVF